MRDVRRTWALMAMIVLTCTAAADAGINVSVKGAKQGQFKAETTREKAADRIEVTGFAYEVTSPRDAASGQASGKRQHKPLQITKAIGASSPQFFQALTTNEPLQSVVLEFTKTDKNGEEYVFFTIKLVNATVNSIRQHTPENASGGKDAAGAAVPVEEISFTFQRIEMESKDGKTMAADDWGVAK
jgi:type VI secretion system secreted protein Hcp